MSAMNLGSLRVFSPTLCLVTPAISSASTDCAISEQKSSITAIARRTLARAGATDFHTAHETHNETVSALQGSF